MWAHLGTLLSIKKIPLATELENTALQQEWQAAITAVHPQAAPHTTYVGLTNNVLHVRVDDALWVGELELHKQLLQTKLNAKRTRPIARIIFRL
jgi:predicted nucleic acid-binding Zn ribbon protein